MKHDSMTDFRGGDQESVEVVQRSGLFGKLLVVEREICRSVVKSMRSAHSYRSSVSRISTNEWGKGEGGIGTAPPQHAAWPSIINATYKY